MKHAEPIGWGLLFALAGILVLLAAPLIVDRPDEIERWAIGGAISGAIGTTLLVYAFLATAEVKPTE